MYVRDAAPVTVTKRILNIDDGAGDFAAHFCISGWKFLHLLVCTLTKALYSLYYMQFRTKLFILLELKSNLMLNFLPVCHYTRSEHHYYLIIVIQKKKTTLK